MLSVYFIGDHSTVIACLFDDFSYDGYHGVCACIPHTPYDEPLVLSLQSFKK